MCCQLPITDSTVVRYVCHQPYGTHISAMYQALHAQYIEQVLIGVAYMQVEAIHHSQLRQVSVALTVLLIVQAPSTSLCF